MEKSGCNPKSGGIHYTVDVDGSPLDEDCYFWVLNECTGAAALLGKTAGQSVFEWLQGRT